MEHPPESLAGVFPVLQTPFDADDEIDAAALAAEIEWVYDCEVDGIVLAMVSEVLRLSTDERRRLAELFCELGLPHGPVIVSVGAESNKVALNLARHAEAAGATAVMAIPPISVAVGDSELAAYYQGILGAVDVPVVVQDASGYVGRPMSIALQADLLATYGQRVLFKPEAVPIGPRLSELRDATDGRARVFEGSGGIALVDSFRRGIVGTMPAADTPWALVALWRALQAGDEARIEAIADPLARLVSLMDSLDAFVAIEKHLLVAQGVIPSARRRGPLGYVPDAETLAEADRLVARLRRAVDG
ncbi:MAG: dihydrodipicolinate synthase family protein [bacterium]|nr:dihydrodipicolinate synthase family protein [bacterium]MDE0667848.1 dihydrodipicolinate synthase family protein [bacterium]MXZ30293.1 dihydrodipicolinate synthase family protein [Acidimicrobiia bacterium]MYJ14100.1 dihydrodipicolinate synthase family protein [Acidimicrobiia bacterium]